MALRILELVVIGIWRCEIVNIDLAGNFVEIVMGMAGGSTLVRTNLGWVPLLLGQVFRLKRHRV